MNPLLEFNVPENQPDFIKIFENHICKTLKKPSSWQACSVHFKKLQDDRKNFNFAGMNKNLKVDPSWSVLQNRIEDYLR